jgi:hypothetical protein
VLRDSGYSRLGRELWRREGQVVLHVVAGRLTQSVTQRGGESDFRSYENGDSSHAADDEEANASLAPCYGRR